jgi:outer membrane murein-binding lipoprotein Lpp
VKKKIAAGQEDLQKKVDDLKKKVDELLKKVEAQKQQDQKAKK